MTYPKPIMSMSELTKLGHPEAGLRQIANSRGQKVAFRYAPRGKIYFYTDKLDGYLAKLAARTLGNW